MFRRPTLMWDVMYKELGGIATCTGWIVRVQNPGGGEIFHPFRPALRPTQPPIQRVPCLSRGLSGRIVALTAHIIQRRGYRKSRAISPLPLWALVACIGLTLPYHYAIYEEYHAMYSSPNIIQVNKSREIRQAGYVACRGERTCSYRIVVGKSEGNIPHGRPSHRWKDNMRMDLKRNRLGGRGLE